MKKGMHEFQVVGCYTYNIKEKTTQEKINQLVSKTIAIRVQIMRTLGLKIVLTSPVTELRTSYEDFLQNLTKGNAVLTLPPSFLKSIPNKSETAKLLLIDKIKQLITTNFAVKWEK